MASLVIEVGRKVFWRCAIMWIISKSLYSFFFARINKLPGMEFDLFGRKLALKGMMRGNLHKYFNLLVNPVSSVRYFEFDFVYRWISLEGSASILDVSSPRILPLFLAMNRNINLTMVNPDPNDLDESRGMASLLQDASIRFMDGVSATKLPFPDNSFDVVVSISVIEHISDDGDSAAMAEFVRVARPGGKIIITFPVMGEYYEEFRAHDPYGSQSWDRERKMFFFQRFYDEEAINERLIAQHNIDVISKEYYIEKKPGIFDKYMRNCIRKGIFYSSTDPLVMLRMFDGPTMDHPKDRMGNCMMVIKVK